MATNNNKVECSELFLIDTSTSMGRRNGFWNFSERTRFEMAKSFLKEVFKDRKESKRIEVALLTYDVNSVKRFGFRQITTKDIHTVDMLEPDGSITATYDAYNDCIQYLRKNGFQGVQERRIIVITDGKDNSSAPEYIEKYKNLQLHLKNEHFMIRTILLHTSTNNDGSKELAHALGWEYKQIREKNVDIVKDNYLDDYPSEYTGMRVNERQKTRRLEALINSAPMPPGATPFLQEHPTSKRIETDKILIREPLIE